MNYMINIALLAIVIALAYGQSTDPLLTMWSKSNGLTGYNGIKANVQKISYTSTAYYIEATGIPAYTVGPWTANPNTPGDQKWQFQIPKNPSQKPIPKTVPGLGAIGVWANGVAIYNGDDGQTYNNLGVWHRNAYVFEGVSFDTCLGHADQSKSYHHHVCPTCLSNCSDASKHSPIIGMAFDGYPIYGPYGYTNPNDATSAIKRLVPGWSPYTYSGGQRSKFPNGTTLPSTPTNYQGPSTTAYASGSFIEDYVYNSGSGDLDECNGRVGKTPEFPNGIYAYFATVDATGTPVYPFVIGQCYYGTPVTPNGAKAAPGDATVYYSGSASFGIEKTMTLLSIMGAFLFTKLF